MRKLVHFVGMKKTGNHAVIPWMQKNAFKPRRRNTAIHFNDLYADYTEQSNLMRPPSVKIENTNRNLLVILSYEDKPLDLVRQLPTVARSHEVIKDAEVQTMLLLRDPYNTFASRLARLKGVEEEGFRVDEHRVDWPRTVETWKSYAREFLGRTQTLGGVIPVNYNRWVMDKGYRDMLLRDNFGQRRNRDRGIEEVGRYGNGSSFDGFSFDGKASEMDVLGRWRTFKDDELYRSLFRDQELVGLSQEIFGHVSGTEILHGNPGGKERR